MNTQIKIKTKKPFVFKELTTSLYGYKNLDIKLTKNDKVRYYFHHGTSAIGVMVAIEKERTKTGTEEVVWVRVTGFSNDADYEIANKIVETIIEVFEGAPYDKKNKLITDLPFINPDLIREIEIDAMLYARNEIRQNKYFTIYGVIRKFYFGLEHMDLLDTSKYEETRIALHRKLKNSQYGLIDYPYSDLVGTQNGKKLNLFTFVTNDESTILGKYTLLLLDIGRKDKYIAITNDDLNTILPAAWKRVDAYTIVAPILPQDEWDAFIERAGKYDKYSTFGKYMKDGPMAMVEED